jgi:chemotaxis signal transduction protein
MNAQAAPAVGAGALSIGKYLTFSVGGEIYGISVLPVREIIRHTVITAVPQLASCIKGVLKFLGIASPIIVLSIKFPLNPAEGTERICILGMAKQEKRVVGLLNIDLIVNGDSIAH